MLVSDKGIFEVAACHVQARKSAPLELFFYGAYSWVHLVTLFQCWKMKKVARTGKPVAEHKAVLLMGQNQLVAYESIIHDIIQFS